MTGSLSIRGDPVTAEPPATTYVTKPPEGGFHIKLGDRGQAKIMGLGRSSDLAEIFRFPRSHPECHRSPPLLLLRRQSLLA
jgi:hypothetical protein